MENDISFSINRNCFHAMKVCFVKFFQFISHHLTLFLPWLSMTTAETTVIYSNFAGFSSQPAVDWLQAGCPLAARWLPASCLLAGEIMPCVTKP